MGSTADEYVHYLQLHIVRSSSQLWCKKFSSLSELSLDIVLFLVKVFSNILNIILSHSALFDVLSHVCYRE